MPDPVRQIIDSSRAVAAFGPDGLTELVTRSRTASSLDGFDPFFLNGGRLADTDGGVATRVLEAFAALHH